MNRGRIAAALAWVIVGGLTAAPVSAQTFEEMVEDALQRNGGAPATPDPSNPQGAQPSGGQPPTTPAAPQPPADAAAPAAPLATPPAPQTAAPKPYTPPSAPAAATTAPAPAASAPGVIPDDGTASVPPGEPPADAADGATAPPERTQASLTVEEVNGATFSPEALAVRGANPLVLKTQILLDRAGASPGVIDGFMGGNVAKAIAAVETVLNLKIDGQLDAEVWAALGGDDAGPALIDYTITDEDAAYPYLDVIPKDYAEQAKLKGLNFTSAEEMFGERFHMDAKLVRALNPDKDLRRAGTAITVADVKGQAITGTIVRIEADKKARQVRAYDAQNRLVVAYPATIGSADNPSPSGIHKVNTIAPNPVYYYNPANFVQGENTSRLQLPPGPNNPVGTMWIDLSEPSYGIHGTPEPSKIDKTGSHGCIRLTNWDAVELSTLVKPGVEVTFTE